MVPFGCNNIFSTCTCISNFFFFQHGAKVIYETDDDNLAEDGINGFHLTETCWGLTIDTHNLTYNPYVHFGQSTLWPRGKANYILIYTKCK